ncbi:uncharacterized protein LOC129981360 [Argiope bruennichi]|uniref:uncharacterized protein LOC129981360 n=1 Tax=Argiope bruennichi TaxID=94029 RepID=UPI0024954B02|nr:uncharacterized protein LOC129981360 [Argiope bruennichi]
MNTVLFTGLLVTLVTLFSTVNSQAMAFAGPGAQNGNMRQWFPPWMWQFVPDIKIPQNWYEGENVCVSEREEPLTGPDPFEGLNENSRDVSQTCKGDMYKYVCVIRTRDNGVTKQTVKTYQCCPGYVRTNDGSPGCVQGSNP